MPYSLDGNLDFSGGVNSGFLSHQIGKSQIFKGFGVSVKDGALSPRPSFIHEEVKVVTKDKIYDFNHILKHGKFQAAIPYEIPGGKYLLTIVSGLIYAIDLNKMTARILDVVDGDRLRQTHDRVHWSYAPGSDSDLEIFDWPNLPLIVEGLNVRRSNLFRLDTAGVPLPETPALRLGVFAQTRLCGANGFDEWAASDSNANINSPAPITFQESLVPGAAYINQTFALPAQKVASKITAMGYLSSANALSRIRSTKYGPMFVASRDTVAVYATNLPRAQWAGEGFGTVELDGLGMPSQRGHINLNADTLFIDQHGRIQSFAKAVSEEGSSWTNFSLSKEISEYTEVPDTTLHQFAVAAAVKDKVFFSVMPYRTRARDLNNQLVFDYASRGIAVLELDNASTLGQGASPTWSGIWANVNPMEISVVGDETYVWSKDCDGVNRLYRVDDSRIYDEFRGKRRTKVSRFYTRAFDHESFFQEKQEHSLSMIMADIEGDVSIKVDRRKEGDSSFHDWGSRVFKGCSSATGAVEFGEPEDKACGLGYHRNQIRTTIEGGAWRIEGIRVKSEILEESDSIDCNKKPSERPVVREVHDLEIDSVCQMKA